MAELSIDIFVSVDGYAFGSRSPAYFGFSGPDLASWIDEHAGRPHRALMGRRTYTVLDELPAEARDAGWHRMVTTPTVVFSRTLTSVGWPGATLCANDAVDEVRTLKQDGGTDLRTIGSMSLARQFLDAELVDHLRLLVFPVVLGQSGQQPAFAAAPDLALELVDHSVLDGRIACYDYRPAGPPPYAA
ncbi:dihydrofolate reductase [Prauserella shujinwangii]|uniref:Dihydrofolate reductase n=1 Tax=Prauserella shujinwangii TaxID=1453103 RepID=A0A2T0M0P5_9PSEU|nr:dihydrofolate reductase family protein [Prauserella shujinwangii]PRX50173.1 dihydrofolate reductase [Prauserella shujinwangii]